MKTGIVLILLLLACLHGALAAFGAGVLTQHYEYDGNGRLVAVMVPENPLLNERYRYDGSGNLVEKQLGERIYRMSYDGAHQLKSQEGPEGFRAFYYDKAGRLVRETLEGKTVVEYRYGYLDKVVEVIRDGERAEFFYDGTGMLAGKRVNGEYEAWTWDGLALVARGDERYVNEGHVSGGVPVLSHSREGMRYHQTDILGTTLATYTADGKMEPVLASAFGADMGLGSLTGTHRFTGKPYDRHLGAHVFPYRNYDSSVARWRSSDPAGFPDGPNGHFYAAVPTMGLDPLGLEVWGALDFLWHYWMGDGSPVSLSEIGYLQGVKDEVESQEIIKRFEIQTHEKAYSVAPTLGNFSNDFHNSYDFSNVHYVIGGATLTGQFQGTLTLKSQHEGYNMYSYAGTATIGFRDTFTDPLDIIEIIYGTSDPDPDVAPQWLINMLNLGGDPYDIFGLWTLSMSGQFEK